jgi:hypothetical protein
LGGRGRQIFEIKTSLVYRVSSRTARATQRNPVSKKKKEKGQVVVAAHTSNSSSWETEDGRFCEFEASMVYGTEPDNQSYT